MQSISEIKFVRLVYELPARSILIGCVGVTHVAMKGGWLLKPSK